MDSIKLSRDWTFMPGNAQQKTLHRACQSLSSAVARMVRSRYIGIACNRCSEPVPEDVAQRLLWHAKRLGHTTMAKALERYR